MSLSNAPLSEQWHRAASAWADAEGAASLLEETKSAVLSQMMMRCEAKTMAGKEAEVKASPDWLDHVTKISKARTAANRAKVEMEFLRLKFFEWQSAQADNRQGARL